MNTAVINIKINSTDKEEAQRVAGELGMPLSVIIKGFLKELTRTQRINFSTSEKPSDYLITSLKRANEDLREKRISPIFKSSKDAITWLNDSQRDNED